MELKPTGKPGMARKGRSQGAPQRKPLESIGAGGDNPWEVVARGATTAAPMGKRRNWAVPALGATPPRDGPFSMAAQDVAASKPPRTRVRRQAGRSWP